MSTDRGATRLGWAEKSVLAFSAAPIAVAGAAATPVLAKMMTVFADYPHASILVKQTVGIIGLSTVIGCPLGGWLARRFDHRLLIGGSYLAFALFGCLGLIISDLYTLLASRLAVGMAAAIVGTVALIALSERCNGQERAVLMGMTVSLGMITGVLMFPLAGYLGAMSWRFPFAMHIATLPLAIATIFMARSKAAPAPHAPTGVSRISMPLRLPILAFFAGFVMMLPTIYLPFHFREIGVDDPKQVSFSLTLYTIMGALTSGLYGRVRAKLDIYQSLATGLAVAAIGLLIVSFSSNVAQIMAGMSVFGAGIGHISPNIYSLVAQLDEEVRAATFGVTKGIKYFAPTVGVFILEPINQAAGPHAAIMIIAAVGFLLMIYVVIDRVPLRAQTRAVVGRV